VAVSSGFMNELQRDKLRKLGVSGFLDKPYREADLLHLVHKMLAKSGKSTTHKKAPAPSTN
jgi:hypothetical protein